MKTAENINEQNKDTLSTWRDKDGLNHAKISVLEGSVADLKKLNSSKDSSLRKLQALVNKNTHSAIVLNTTTTNKGKGKTTVTYPTDNSGEHHIVYDTLHTGDCPPCPAPTYSTQVDEPYLKGTIVANKDSVHYDLKSYNEFQIVEERKREKFWKEKTLKINIKNLNPNTETTGLKAWVEKKPKVRRGLIFLSGVVIGSVGTGIGIQQLSKVFK